MDWTTKNLEELLPQIWSQLERACQEAGNPWRTPALGTANDLEASLRTMVLRQVHPARRELVCHTDGRSRKARELQKHPQIQWLFYDPSEGIQIRAGGTALIHQLNPVARTGWEKTPVANRLNYCTALAPGTRLTDPDVSLPEHWRNCLPTRDETEVGWPNFAVLVSTIDQIEWLQLRTEGHRRAGFTWQDNRFSGHWLVP